MRWRVPRVCVGARVFFIAGEGNPSHSILGMLCVRYVRLELRRFRSKDVAHVRLISIKMALVHDH